MNKYFLLFIFILCCVTSVSATPLQETDISIPGDFNTIAGYKYIEPNYAIEQPSFLLYNDGTMIYNVFGSHIDGHLIEYHDGCLATLRPGEYTSLPCEGYYWCYAVPRTVDNITVKEIEYNIYQYWFVAVLLVIGCIVLFIIWRVIKK